MGTSLSGTSATFVQGREFMPSVTTMMVWKTSDMSLLLPRMTKMIRLTSGIDYSDAPPKTSPYVGLNFQIVFLNKGLEVMHRFNSSFAPTNVLPLSPIKSSG